METCGKHGYWEDLAGDCNLVWPDICMWWGGGQQDFGQWGGNIYDYHDDPANINNGLLLIALDYS